MNKVEAYIERSWDLCIRENVSDEGDLIGLPYPYTVPCFCREDLSSGVIDEDGTGKRLHKVEYFNEMYYWDTYFTNVGLLLSGRASLAKNNADNMLFLIEKYGYMPNGNRTYFLDRSQPPFLSAMVRDVYDHFKDKEWLKKAYSGLETEYGFWMTNRSSDIGLNHYGHNTYVCPAEEYASWYIDRIGYTPEDSVDNMASHFMATAESGWDVSPRFRGDAFNFAAVDLNSILYMLEDNMSYFAKELNNSCEGVWKQRALHRKNLMARYMDSGDGLLLDYNFADGKHSDVLSAATFYPLFAGLADRSHAEALVNNLHRLETPHGILSCEKTDIRGSFQWGYPNGWACLHYIAMVGLDRYGYKEEAKRIAKNYLALVERLFEESGNLWEKYNVVEGNINVTNEYEMPPMMGWTAGVYLGAKNFIDNN